MVDDLAWCKCKLVQRTRAQFLRPQSWQSDPSGRLHDVCFSFAWETVADLRRILCTLRFLQQLLEHERDVFWHLTAVLIIRFAATALESQFDTHISPTFKRNTFLLIIFHKSIDIYSDIKSQIKSNAMMFRRYMSCGEEEKLSTQRILWEKKVLCPSQDRLKEQWQKTSEWNKPKKNKKTKQNCSIQHGDDCQAEIDSYLDSFFVPLITQTVLRDSGRVPRVMTDSVLWEWGGGLSTFTSWMSSNKSVSYLNQSRLQKY